MDMRNKISAHQHRPERFSTEKMDVEVRNLLMTMDSGIGEQPITRRHQPLFAGNMADGPDETGYLRFARLRAEIIPADLAPLGDDQYVNRCLRIDVVKGERPFILIYRAVVDLPAQDFGEDILLIIRQSGVDGHASSFPAGFFFYSRNALASFEFAQYVIKAQIRIREQYGEVEQQIGSFVCQLFRTFLERSNDRFGGFLANFLSNLGRTL